MNYKWMRCPKCGNEHFIKVSKETRIYKFSAYCKWCKKEIVINVEPRAESVNQKTGWLCRLFFIAESAIKKTFWKKIFLKNTYGMIWKLLWRWLWKWALWVTVQMQAWHLLSSYAPIMKLCRITAPCIEDAFEMGCNRYCSTVGVYSNLCG